MSTIKVDAIQDTSGNDQYTAQAWITYDGTTNTINGSGNVSSLTDTATGRHTPNFSNAFSSANYAAGCSCYQPDYSSANMSIGKDYTLSITTTAYPLFVQNGSGGKEDRPNCCGIFME